MRDEIARLMRRLIKFADNELDFSSPGLPNGLERGVRAAFAIGECARAVEEMERTVVLRTLGEKMVAEFASQMTEDEDPEMELAAMRFAEERHRGQSYGRRPYTAHLFEVRQVLRDVEIVDDVLLSAAWLHDVVEDGKAMISEVEKHFGAEVAELVWAVTGEGPNRRVRNQAVYEKIRGRGDAAANLKLADRIANVECALREGSEEHLKMYAEESVEFRTQFRGLGDERLWERLLAALNAYYP
ncbi:MAG: HD domain-containing protein [Candidatus Fermentibacter sp.]|nr:HD domain-containing protein [Candidatus Fermentibacter sp.]